MATLSHVGGFLGTRHAAKLLPSCLSIRAGHAKMLASYSVAKLLLSCVNVCRAFHEKCVDPPVVLADIPEDEGWLCPACDAKVTPAARSGAFLCPAVRAAAHSGPFLCPAVQPQVSCAQALCHSLECATPHSAALTFQLSTTTLRECLHLHVCLWARTVCLKVYCQCCAHLSLYSANSAIATINAVPAG